MPDPNQNFWNKMMMRRKRVIDVEHKEALVEKSPFSATRKLIILHQYITGLIASQFLGALRSVHMVNSGYSVCVSINLSTDNLIVQQLL